MVNIKELETSRLSNRTAAENGYRKNLIFRTYLKNCRKLFKNFQSYVGFSEYGKVLQNSEFLFFPLGKPVYENTVYNNIFVDIPFFRKAQKTRTRDFERDLNFCVCITNLISFLLLSTAQIEKRGQFASLYYCSGNITYWGMFQTVS